MDIDKNREFVHYYHGKSKNGFRFTAAFLPSDLKDKSECSLIGLALCSPKDNFNKKKGRNISSERLLNRSSSITTYIPYTNIVGFTSRRNFIKYCKTLEYLDFKKFQLLNSLCDMHL
jgi:hypothetical protein